MTRECGQEKGMNTENEAKITFLLSNADNADCRKCIAMLERAGAEVEQLAFRRNDQYLDLPRNSECRLLGEIGSGWNLRRLVRLCKAAPRVRRSLSKANIVFAFGLDMLMLAWIGRLFLRKRPKLAVEILDIRAVMTGGSMKSWMLRCIEKFLMRRVDLLVLTSPAYFTEYFRDRQGIEDVRYLVVENKLVQKEDGITEVQDRTRQDGKIRIGYWGCIRCERSLLVLERAAELGRGRVRVVIRGTLVVPVTAAYIAALEERNPWIEYGGPYSSPSDMPDIYGPVDLIWACYPYSEADTGNYQWARTNRFYEACLFKRPMITQKGTQDDAVNVKEGIGLSVDLSDVDAAAEQISSISDRDLAEWQRQMHRLPEETYLYTDEHRTILEILKT